MGLDSGQRACLHTVRKGLAARFSCSSLSLFRGRLGGLVYGLVVVRSVSLFLP
jgi:hypothetical protein